MFTYKNKAKKLVYCLAKILIAIPSHFIRKTGWSLTPSTYSNVIFGPSIFVCVPPNIIKGEVSISNKMWWVAKGNWDKKSKKATSKLANKIMTTLVENHEVDFDQLYLFKKLKNDIASGSPVKVNNGVVIRTAEELTSFFITRQSIIDSLRKKGMTVVEDPVTLAIGRHGDIYKTGDGRHRIAAAQTMNINVVGCIKHVHPKWLQKHGDLSKNNIRTALSLLSDQKSRNGKSAFANS